MLDCCLMMTCVAETISVPCLNTCQNASRAFCTSLLGSANALFAGMCCGFFMPENTFCSDRTKFPLVREHCPNCGVKVCWSCWEIITLNLNGKVMLLLKQQGRSRLNLQHASHLIFGSKSTEMQLLSCERVEQVLGALGLGRVFCVCLVSWSLFHLYHRNSNNCKLRTCLEIEPLF